MGHLELSCSGSVQPLAVIHVEAEKGPKPLVLSLPFFEPQALESCSRLRMFKVTFPECCCQALALVLTLGLLSWRTSCRNFLFLSLIQES